MIPTADNQIKQQAMLKEVRTLHFFKSYSIVSCMVLHSFSWIRKIVVWFCICNICTFKSNLTIHNEFTSTTAGKGSLQQILFWWHFAAFTGVWILFKTLAMGESRILSQSGDLFCRILSSDVLVFPEYFYQFLLFFFFIQFFFNFLVLSSENQCCLGFFSLTDIVFQELEVEHSSY